MKGQTESRIVQATADTSDPVGDSPVASPARSRRVVVIGAGVSGCACAATLASAGVSVLLVNSAMDRVGLPAYGPDLISSTGDWGGIEDVIMSLPDPLRRIWLDAALRPEGGGAIMNIDRRRVSIETKRLLESIPGLQFRQGFVVDLRVVGAGESASVQAETIFQEIFEADAAVVAVGLSLAGKTSLGGETVEGGRYGEPASNGLCEALDSLGAVYREGVLNVGPRIPSRDLAWLEDEGHAHSALKIRLVAARATDPDQAWPEGYPPAPHLDAGLRCDVMLEARAATEQLGGSATEMGLPLVSPDGAATGELYVVPGDLLTSQRTLAAEHKPATEHKPAAERLPAPEDTFAAAQEPDLGEPPATQGTSAGGSWIGRGATAPVETRVAVRVAARVVANTARSGRLFPESEALPVWVVGRAGGADDYLQSLASGVDAALNIVAVLGGDDERA